MFVQKLKETSKKIREERKIKYKDEREIKIRYLMNNISSDIKKVLEEAANNGRNTAHFNIKKEYFKNITDDFGDEFNHYDVASMVIGTWIYEDKDLDGLKYKVSESFGEEITIEFTW